MQKTFIKILLSLSLFLGLGVIFTETALAAVITWDGGGSTNDWSEGANWTGTPDNTAPGASDVATFNGTSTKNATINAGFGGSVAGVAINSGYTGVITAGRSLTVGSSNFNQASGEFNSGAQTIDFNSDLILSGGIFTASSGTMTIGNDLTISGSPTFSANGGTITFDGGNTFNTATCNGVTFNAINISKDAGAGFTVSSGCTFPILGTDPTLTAGTISNSGTINITGNPTLPSYTSNTGAVLTTTGTSITLTNTLTLTAGTFPSGITTLLIAGSLVNTGNLLPNGMDVTFNGGGTSHTHTCGSVSFNSVTISKGVSSVENINSGCTFPIAGTNPTITGYIVNSGTINVTGNLTITSYSSPSATSVLTMTGNTISVTDDLILTSGTFPSGITTISLARDLNNSGNLLPNNIALSYTGGGGSGNDLNCGNASFSSITTSKDVVSSIALGSDCTTADLAITSGGSFSNPTSARTIYVTGNFSGQATGTLGGANLTLEFTGSSSQTVSMTAGTIASVFRINKTGANSASLTSAFLITTQSLTVVEGIFDTNGNSFEYGSGFTVEDGGTLRLIGREPIETPTLNTGSTVVYKGDGDGSADTYYTRGWSYKNLTTAFTDSADTLDAPTSDTLTSSEVGYWKMNEGSGTVEDSSTNNNTATPTNAIFTATAPDIEDANPYAMDFDGSGDYLDMGNNLSLAQNLSVFTIAAWIKKDSNSGVDQIFGLSTGDSTADSRAALATTGDEIICSGSAGDTEAVQSRTTSATNLLTGIWYHVTCIVDYASDTATIYLNSVSQSATGTVSFTATTTSNTVSQRSAIGIDEDKVGNDFDGQIDEVRVYTRALTQSEIQAMSAGFSNLTVSSRTIAGDMTISGGQFISPATLNIGGNFSNSATFTHNSGTAILNGTNQTLSGSTTFYNLTKNVTSAATLTLPASSTQTIANTMTLTGQSGALLSLRSSSSPTQARIDPQGTRTISYLDVKDNYNINATAIDITGFNITNSGNNTGWNFNATPNVPSSLGPSSVTGGGWVTDSTPTFDFTLSDNDSSDTVRFRIIIDDTSDFSSAVVDYTSALAAQGAFSFTVGQAAGTGTYTTGSSGQTLSGTSYYWRVQASDSNSAQSGWATANSGNVAFMYDSGAPTAPELDSPANNSYTNSTRPGFRWKTSSDTHSGTSSYTLEVDNGATGDFSITGIPTSRTSNYETSTYLAQYTGFSDSDSTNNYITVYTKSSASWPSSQNDGQLKTGKVVWTVKATDNAGNEASGSRNLFVDQSSPSIVIQTINNVTVSGSDTLFVSDTTPTLVGLALDSQSSSVASGPKIARVVVEKISKSKKTTSYQTVFDQTLNISALYWTVDDSKITDNSLNTSSKYAPISFAINNALSTTSDYRVTVTGQDLAGNSSVSQVFIFNPNRDSSQTAIFGLRALDITQDSALVTWNTNHPADSSVDYGSSQNLGESIQSAELVEEHSLRLSGLTSGSRYYFRAMSRGGSLAESGILSFSTLVAPTPTPTTEPTVIEEILEEAASSASELVAPIVEPIIKLLLGVVSAVSQAVEDVRQEMTDSAMMMAIADSGQTIAAVSATVTTLAVVVPAASAVTMGMTAAVSIAPAGYAAASTATLAVKGFIAGLERFLSGLFASLELVRRRRRTDGVSFDTSNNLSLASVLLMFHSKSGNLKIVYSDTDGRFRLQAPSDSYEVKAKKKGFKFPSSLVTVAENNLFPHIYQPGVKIQVISEAVDPYAVPLDPVLEKLSRTRKTLIKTVNYFTYFLFHYYFQLLLATTALSVYSLWLIPTPVNSISTAVNVLALGVSVRKRILHRKWGVVVDKSGRPIPRAIVRLYRFIAGKEELYSATLADEDGRYLLHPEEGQYTLRVYTVGGRMSLAEKAVETSKKTPYIRDYVRCGA